MDAIKNFIQLLRASNPDVNQLYALIEELLAEKAELEAQLDV